MLCLNFVECIYGLDNCVFTTSHSFWMEKSGWINHTWTRYTNVEFTISCFLSWSPYIRATMVRIQYAFLFDTVWILSFLNKRPAFHIDDLILPSCVKKHPLLWFQQRQSQLTRHYIFTLFFICCISGRMYRNQGYCATWYSQNNVSRGEKKHLKLVFITYFKSQNNAAGLSEPKPQN